MEEEDSDSDFIDDLAMIMGVGWGARNQLQQGKEEKEVP